MKWELLPIWLVLITLSALSMHDNKRITELELFQQDTTALLKLHTEGFGEVEEILHTLIESFKLLKEEVQPPPNIAEPNDTEPFLQSFEEIRPGIWLYRPDMGYWIGYWSI